jgi:hypothetical protein
LAGFVEIRRSEARLPIGPDFFHAVEIDGEAYWDGGYTGNPALVRSSCACRAAIS